MGTGIFFPASALLFSILIIILFFAKEHIRTTETKLYSILIVTNFFGLLIEIMCTVASYIIDVAPITSTIIFKLYLVYIISWALIFTIYVYYISNSNDKIKKYGKYLKNSVFIFLIISIIMIFILPINAVVKDNFQIRYTEGPSVIFTYSMSIFLVFIMILCMLRNYKNLKNKKYLPLFSFLAFGFGAMIFQMFNPSILLMTYIETFVSVMMYHTIENPDVHMIKQLNIAKDSAEKANLAKTEFLSNMSHEIRTPLNAIVGFSECMVDSNDLNETKQFAKDIVDASNNLLEIVNGILDISKIEANKMEIIPKEYNPREVFNSLSKLAKTRIGDKPIEFKMFMANDLPGVLKGDVAKVKQIVLNILTNAAKYTDRGEINFNVNCINRTDSNTCLMYISVRDTGRGIKKEDVDKLFNKFERLDEDKNTTVEGTGLGLAITKSLAEMMGGRITVQSKYGEGSNFRVYLEQEIVSMEIPESKSEEIEIDYSLHTGKRILVVDDSKINLKVALQILKPYNFNVVTAESGFEAIDLAQSQTFDLILMDIMMPKMNGVEALRRLKEISGFDVPVVALTADAIEGTDEKYINAGFNDYLSKPIDRYLLNKVLNKYLGGKK